MRIDGLDENKRPAACIACGRCVHACPQGIKVPLVLAELAQLYEDLPKWAVTAKKREASIKKDLEG